MAFLLKNAINPSTRLSNGDAPVVEQWIRVTRATDTLTQSATTNEPLFTVSGGRILLKALVGEVTVAISGGTTPDLQIEFDPVTGTTIDLATDVAITSDEVGTLYSIAAPAAALVATSSGWGNAVTNGGVILNPGTLDLELTESSIAGEIKWDLYYMPLDPAAYVTPTAV